MRARNIKPSFFANEQLAELPFEARLLFIGLWCLADREGRLEDRPKRIKMNLFPADALDVKPLLEGLVQQKLIVRYVENGMACIWIPNFSAHQRPHSKESPSELPAPPQAVLSTNLGGGEHALNPESPFLIPECSLSERGAQAPTLALVAVTETPSAEKRATRLPADFDLTPERRAVAVAERVDPERTFAKFCNYWKAKSGQHARKIDWEATWVNWVMRESDGNGKAGSGKRLGAFERSELAMAEWARERGIDPASI